MTVPDLFSALQRDGSSLEGGNGEERKNGGIRRAGRGGKRRGDGRAF